MKGVKTVSVGVPPYTGSDAHITLLSFGNMIHVKSARKVIVKGSIFKIICVIISAAENLLVS